MKNFDDVVINKVTSIRHRIARAREEYGSNKADFLANFTKQDAAMLNINRACEQAIDLANHIVKLRGLGVPNEARDSFTLLAKAQIIEENLEEKLHKMIDFRNLLIHEYEDLNIDIVAKVIEKNLDDLLLFADVVLVMDLG